MHFAIAVLTMYVAHAGLELKKSSCLCLLSAGIERQATTPGHVYICGAGRGGAHTLQLSQSSHFTHHPRVSAPEFAFPAYRKGKRQVLGLDREFVSPHVPKGTAAALKMILSLACKLRPLAPQSHHCKARLSNIHPLESPLRRAQPLRQSRAGLSARQDSVSTRMSPRAARSSLPPWARDALGVSRWPVRRSPLYPRKSTLTENLARVALGEHTVAQLFWAHVDFELKRGSIRERAAPLGHDSGYHTQPTAAHSAPNTRHSALGPLLRPARARRPIG